MGHTASLSASATDPGSDDLIFDWNVDGTSTFFNDGASPDSYPRYWYGVAPFTADNGEACFTYEGPGQVIDLSVRDDDGGLDKFSLIL